MGAVYDTIVVGVGAMGAATCWQLARRGKRVLGLERFDIPNAMGSSHGDTRMIRLAYFEGPAYVPMVRRAHALWHEIGALAGERLLFETGSLDMAAEGDGVVEPARQACIDHGLPYEAMTAAEVMRRWPQFRLPAGHAALYQPQGGFIASERGIVVQAALAMDAGADIRAQERVLGFEPFAGGVRVTTDRGTYEAGSVVLSPGGWIGALAPELASLFRPYRQVFGWFRPADRAPYRMGAMPSFTLKVEDGHYYGFPLWNHPGVKVGGPHHAREACDPETLSRTARPADVDLLRDCLRRHLPDLDGDCLALRVCFYTFTSDEHFVIDTLPGHPQVVVASPCSGHGYKFASVMGEILADLATGRQPAFDLSSFALARFAA
ncbi:N-methyl-L-tryptophan oxidase [Alsobacter sp. R-9]